VTPCVGVIGQVSASYGDNKVAWYSGVGPRMLDLYGGEQLPISRSVLNCRVSHLIGTDTDACACISEQHLALHLLSVWLVRAGARAKPPACTLST
jgi:hypothetical protein